MDSQYNFGFYNPAKADPEAYKNRIITGYQQLDDLRQKLDEARNAPRNSISDEDFRKLEHSVINAENTLRGLKQSSTELFDQATAEYNASKEQSAKEAQAAQAAQAAQSEEVQGTVTPWDGLISRLQNANSDAQPDYGFSMNAPVMDNVYNFKPANVDAEWQPPFSNGYDNPLEAVADKSSYTIDDVAKAAAAEEAARKAAYRGSDANSKPVEYQPVKTQRPVYNPNADWRDQEMSLAQLGSLSQATKYLGNPADAIQMSQAIDQGRISAAMQNPSVMQNIEDNMRNGMTFAEAQSAALTSYLQGMGNNRASATTMGLYTTAADDAAGKALALAALTGDNYAALKGPMGYTPLGLSSAAVDPNNDTIMALQGRNGTQSIDRGSMMNVLAALNPKYGSGVAQALAGNLALYNNPLEIQKNVTDMLSKEVQAYRANSGKSPYELALKAEELVQKGDYQNARLILEQMKLDANINRWDAQTALKAQQVASAINSQASKFGQVGNQSGVSYSNTPN